MDAILKSTGERGAAYRDEAGGWVFVVFRFGVAIENFVLRSDIVLIRGN